MNSQKTLHENKEVRVVFLDINKAFDRVRNMGSLRQQRICIRSVSSSSNTRHNDTMLYKGINQPDPKVLKLSSCSTQLSMKFKSS